MVNPVSGLALLVLRVLVEDACVLFRLELDCRLPPISPRLGAAAVALGVRHVRVLRCVLARDAFVRSSSRSPMLRYAWVGFLGGVRPMRMPTS